MSEQDDGAVNPGQAIYDALSVEAKAAVDALPDELFSVDSDLTSRFVATIQRAQSLRPTCWALLVGGESVGRIYRNVTMNDKVVLGEYKNEVSVACDRTALPTNIDTILEELSGNLTYPYKDQEVAYMKLPRLALQELPDAIWKSHNDLLGRFAGLNHARSTFYYIHRDDARAKLAIATGEELPPPDYVGKNRIGLPMAGSGVDATKTRYWKISAGPGGSEWELFTANAVAAMDWHEASVDLSDFPANRVDFIARVGDETEASRQGAVSLWQFRSEMEVGDLVLVYSGFEILGLGTLTGDYFYDLDAERFRHRRSVAWQEERQQPTTHVSSELQAKLSRQQTLVELTGAEFHEATGQLSNEESYGAAVINLGSTLASGFASAGLTYTPSQIGSFYTALQTKGFVILSGISGTGKSKIAQQFAKMLPNITANVALPLAEDYVRIAVQPYMKKYKRVRLWNEVSEGLPVPPNGTSVMVPFTLDGRKGKCRVWNRPETNAGTYLFPQGELGQEFKDLAVDHFAMRFQIDENEDRIASIEMRTELPIEPDAGVEGESRLPNRLFLSVRPDWRDGKALIGYHNPLSGEYQRTPFLDFIIAAGDDYKVGNRNAFFVILDEMNLAHVEYYFADVLSVIESGRDELGWTVEGISLAVGEEDADLPETLPLPPNLYIVGTVNMDETTHPFSPKVLDRAFTIELTEVDFNGYPPDEIEASESGDDDKQALLRAFISNGYPRIDKGDIRHVVDRPERFGVDLQNLNLSLRRSRMHFGYRVFDEIMQFVFNAEENGLFTANEAFDHAVLMKVLPKFNGSRAKLQTALFELIHWCHTTGTMSSDDRANLEARFAKLTDDHTSFDAVVPKDSEAVEDQWRYPATGRRAALMMQDLYTDGFAAFG